MKKLRRLILTDYRTEVSASAQTAFRFFQDFRSWPEWASCIAAADAKGDPWVVGRSLRFRPRILGRPFIWLPVRIFELRDGERIRWGVKTPLGSQFHQFTFSPRGANRCSVHHEEWATGVLALVNAPAKAIYTRFNQRWADDLTAALNASAVTAKTARKPRKRA